MKTLKTMARGLALTALVIIRLPLTLVVLVGVLLSFIVGMVFLFPWAIRLARAMTRFDRRLTERWLGVHIDEPYRAAPPPPVRQADGWYRDGRTLYRKPTIPAYHARLGWLLQDPATWRELVWLVLDPWIRLVLAAGPSLLIVYGGWLAFSGHLWGLMLPVAGWVAAPYALGLYAYNALGMLGPTASAELEGQVARLNRARVDAVDHQAAELRRIERDLHDGAQARLVAVGMTIGAAEQLLETDPAAARALLVKAREASATALAELRQLVRGIHPPVLAERGLGDAIRALALDSPLKVKVTVDVMERPESPVESAVYFAVAELLANASRHASRVAIDISRRGRALRVTVTDDGNGGAAVAPGGGLAGIERRLSAFDGVLALNSPPGGPTVATIEMPGVLSTEEVTENALQSRRRMIIAGICWTVCWIPLFPQGIVAGFMLLTGVPERSWFLALYMPQPFAWLTIASMITLGATILATGVALSNDRPLNLRSCC